MDPIRRRGPQGALKQQLREDCEQAREQCEPASGFYFAVRVVKKDEGRAADEVAPKSHLQFVVTRQHSNGRGLLSKGARDPASPASIKFLG